MALPDFLVIGAPKAGTTALHAALARHPELFMSAVKEPKFFLTDGPPPRRGGGPGDVQTYREHIWRREDYEALFDAAPPGALRGESTPFYLYDRAGAAADPRADPRRQDDRRSCVTRWSGRTPTGPTCGRPGWSPIGDFLRACASRGAPGRGGLGAVLALHRARPVRRAA